jgi:hypothetical protein
MSRPSATPPITASSTPESNDRLDAAESAVEAPEELSLSDPNGEESGLSLLVGCALPLPVAEVLLVVAAVAMVVCELLLDSDEELELLLAVVEEDEEDEVPDIVPKPAIVSVMFQEGFVVGNGGLTYPALVEVEH